MFLCVQTLHKSSSDMIGDIAITSAPQRIIGSGHSMFAFDYDAQVQPDLADDDNGMV